MKQTMMHSPAPSTIEQSNQVPLEHRSKYSAPPCHSGVYGSAQVLHLLRQASAEPQSLRHAYLLLGPRHVGKTTAARTLAATLFCDSDSRPCGHCRSCRLLASGNHPDFRLIQPTDRDDLPDRDDGILRDKQVDEIVRDATRRPIEGRHTFFLIQDAHLANATFANKLLKTLEEPPSSVVLCLTASDRSQLLPTIVSRCQVIEMRALPPGVVEDALRAAWKLPSQEAMLLDRLADGRLGWAVLQHADESARQQRDEQLDLLTKMMHADRIERLALAASMAGQRDNRQLFSLLEVWLSWARDLMLARHNCLHLCSNIDRLEALAQQAHQLDEEAVHAWIQTLQRIESYLHHTINTRLALDVLLLRLPYLPRT